MGLPAVPDDYDRPGFGAFLLHDRELLDRYRERLRELGEENASLAEMPRLVTIWRDDSDSARRADWSPRQVETWIQTKNWDQQDLEEFHVLVGAFIAGIPPAEVRSLLPPSAR